MMCHRQPERSVRSLSSPAAELTVGAIKPTFGSAVGVAVSVSSAGCTMTLTSRPGQRRRGLEPIHLRPSLRAKLVRIKSSSSAS
jgi:hypothetical protein